MYNFSLMTSPPYLTTFQNRIVTKLARLLNFISNCKYINTTPKIKMNRRTASRPRGNPGSPLEKSDRKKRKKRTADPPALQKVTRRPDIPSRDARKSRLGSRDEIPERPDLRQQARSPSSRRACSRAASVTSVPLSMRAICSTRSEGASFLIRVAVPEADSSLYTKKWSLPLAAT